MREINKLSRLVMREINKLSRLEVPSIYDDSMFAFGMRDRERL